MDARRNLVEDHSGIWIQGLGRSSSSSGPYSDVPTLTAMTRIPARKLISLFKSRRVDALLLENYGWVARRSAVEKYARKRTTRLLTALPARLKTMRHDGWTRIRAFVFAIFARAKHARTANSVSTIR